ncbi:protein CDV3 homolog [Physella acuta]|nr:protein CDV3 homolog [Physella acuta]
MKSTSTKTKDKKTKDKDKLHSTSGTLNILTNQQEDEEWKDFEEEKEKDYSGLRIQNLQITKEQDDREAADSIDNGDDDDRDNKDRRDGASGPWNKSNTLSTTAPVQVQIHHHEPDREETTPKAPAKYVPPAQRHTAHSSVNTPNFPSSRKKKEAPNVNSEEDFPTLGGASTTGKSLQYSNTASSDLIENPHQRKSVNLTLENKFSALQD